MPKWNLASDRKYSITVMTDSCRIILSWLFMTLSFLKYV